MSAPAAWRLALALLAGSSACGDGMPPEPQPERVPAVTGLVLDDVSNFGDGRDLEVAFDAPTVETSIAEYRVFLVAGAEGASLSLEAAEALTPDRSTVVAPGQARPTVRLSAGVTDIEGSAVADGGTYTAFVMSVAADGAVANALSAASNAMPVAVTTIKITYLGAAGVLVADAERAVIVDGLSGNLSGWIQMSDADFADLTQASVPFDGIDLVLASHNHGDHFSPASVNAFMSRNSGASFIGPPQVTSSLSLGARAVAVSPARGERVTASANDVAVDVLHLRHFDQFGNDFSQVENYGFLMELGGLRVLHLGDVDYSAANLEPFGLAMETIDIVILPTFNTLLSAANAQTVESLIDPDHVIALHFQANQVGSESQQAADLFGAVGFTRPMQFVRF